MERRARVTGRVLFFGSGVVQPDDQKSLLWPDRASHIAATQSFAAPRTCGPKALRVRPSQF